MVINSSLVTRTVEPQAAPFRRDVRRGFVSMIPLWPGVCAFGITYAILAAGLFAVGRIAFAVVPLAL